MTAIQNEQWFAHDLIVKRRHAYKIEFEVPPLNWDTVRLVFEQSGYSVHLEKTRPGYAVAFRVRPDTAPVVCLR
jgi:hypothetical protein